MGNVINQALDTLLGQLKLYLEDNEIIASIELSQSSNRYFSVLIKLNYKKIGELLGAKICNINNETEFYYLCEGEPLFFYKDIFEDNAYLKHEVVFPEKGVIFDVGANIGYFSIHLSKKCKDILIYAFEPAPDVFEVLSLNALSLNLNLKPMNIGLSDKDSNMQFTYYPNSSALSTFYENYDEEYDLLKAVIQTQIEGIQEEDEEIADYEEVIEDLLRERLRKVQYNCTVKTISSVIHDHELEYVDLLKIDVEKSELDIIRGISICDFKKIGQLIVEVHDKDDNLKTIINILEANDFLVTVNRDENFKDTIMSSVYAVNANFKGRVSNIPVKHLNGFGHFKHVTIINDLETKICDFFNTKGIDYRVEYAR